MTIDFSIKIMLVHVIAPTLHYSTWPNTPTFRWFSAHDQNFPWLPQNHLASGILKVTCKIVYILDKQFYKSNNFPIRKELVGLGETIPQY
jgi:hypothetical protein